MVHKCCVFYLPAFLKGPLGYRVRWMVKGKKEKKKAKSTSLKSWSITMKQKLTQPPT